jgi:hypothetical protein
MFGIWIKFDYLHKDTASPVPLAEPPTKDGKLVSSKLAADFALGWIGTLVRRACHLMRIIKVSTHIVTARQMYNALGGISSLILLVRARLPAWNLGYSSPCSSRTSLFWR